MCSRVRLPHSGKIFRICRHHYYYVVVPVLVLGDKTAGMRPVIANCTRVSLFDSGGGIGDRLALPTFGFIGIRTPHNYLTVPFGS